MEVDGAACRSRPPRPGRPSSSSGTEPRQQPLGRVQDPIGHRRFFSHLRTPGKAGARMHETGVSVSIRGPSPIIERQERNHAEPGSFPCPPHERETLSCGSGGAATLIRRCAAPSPGGRRRNESSRAEAPPGARSLPVHWRCDTFGARLVRGSPRLGLMDLTPDREPRELGGWQGDSRCLCCHLLADIVGRWE